MFPCLDTTMKDVEKVTASGSCKFLRYEIEHVTHLLANIEHIQTVWKEGLENGAPAQDRTLGSEVVDKVEILKQNLMQLYSDLEGGNA